MKIRIAISIVFFCSLGCGGTQSKGASHGAASGSGKEKDCLAAAASHAQPKADAPAHISVAHILVRHAALARPEGATRTRGQACLRALEALNKLNDIKKLSGLR